MLEESEGRCREYRGGTARVAREGLLSRRVRVLRKMRLSPLKTILSIGRVSLAVGFGPKKIFDNQLIVGNEPNMLKLLVRQRQRQVGGRVSGVASCGGRRRLATAVCGSRGRAVWKRPTRSVRKPFWFRQRRSPLRSRTRGDRGIERQRDGNGTRPSLYHRGVQAGPG